MNKKNAGETIIEVLIATVILVTVLTASFSLLNRGVKTNINFERRSIALNIAGEGIEAVRNIRDTNWLKYSGDMRNKWLCLDSEDTPDACMENLVSITDGFYQIEFSENLGRYFLTKIEDAEALNIENNSAEAESFALFSDNTNHRFTHTALDNVATPFYRQIQLTPVENNTCPLPANCTEQKLEVISRVQWYDTDTMESVVLETRLFDFFERDAY